VTGASKDSRFYAVDDILVRVLGAILVILGVALLGGQSQVILPLAFTYFFSILEVLLTARSRSVMAIGTLFFGVPFLYLLFYFSKVGITLIF
jgi:hypothetical protein